MKKTSLKSGDHPLVSMPTSARTPLPFSAHSASECPQSDHMPLSETTRTPLETGSAVRWVVYMIESSNGALYTGITTNVARRLHEHQHSKKGARFFRSHSAVAVRYQEPAISRSQALQREAFIKKLTRVQKWQLIHSQAATSIK